MSLINDALKRVSEADRGKPASQTDFATASLQPAPYERRTSPLIWIAIPALIVAVGLGGYLLAKTKKSSQPTGMVQAALANSQPDPAPATATTPPATPNQQPAAAAVTIAQPVVSAPQSNALAVSNSQSATRPAEAVVRNPQSDSLSPASPVSSAQAAPTPAQPAPVVPTGPTFRLKGILYTKNPTALINDASLHVGGEIDGATVTKIDATTVTLDYQGKPTVLKLGIRQ